MPISDSLVVEAPSIVAWQVLCQMLERKESIQ